MTASSVSPPPAVKLAGRPGPVGVVAASSGKNDAPRLRQRLRVALPIAMILAPRPNITLMILGGRVRGRTPGGGRGATPSSTWRSWAPTACPESALWCGEPPVRPQPCAGQRPGPIARAQCRSRWRGQGGGPTKRRGSGHDCGSSPGSDSDGSTGATFGHRHARSARSPTRRWSLRRSVGRAGGDCHPTAGRRVPLDIHGAGPYDCDG